MTKRTGAGLSVASSEAVEITAPLVDHIIEAIVGAPGTSAAVASARAAYKAHLRRKAEQLGRLWLEEFADGNAPVYYAASEDDRIEIVARILRCAEEGAARANLRLLLRVLKGMSVLQPVYASEFAKYQRMLAHLNREELFLLAVFHQESSRDEALGAEKPVPRFWARVKERLVPDVFPTEEHMRGTAYMALRSGLLMQEGNMEANGFVVPSPHLAEVFKLASIEEALSAEGIHVP